MMKCRKDVPVFSACMGAESERPGGRLQCMSPKMSSMHTFTYISAVCVLTMNHGLRHATSFPLAPLPLTSLTQASHRPLPASHRPLQSCSSRV